MAVDTGLGRRNSSKTRLLDRSVAIAAVDAQPGYVMLMAKCTGCDLRTPAYVMYGERSICTMAQNTPATATTVSTIEARAIALLLRGKICIEYEFFIYCGMAQAAPGGHIPMITSRIAVTKVTETCEYKQLLGEME